MVLAHWKTHGGDLEFSRVCVNESTLPLPITHEKLNHPVPTNTLPLTPEYHSLSEGP